MSYGMSKPKTPVCTLGVKHKWVFVKNGQVTKTSSSMGGGCSVQISLRGLYKCACGQSRIGQANYNAPNADLRAEAQGVKT